MVERSEKGVVFGVWVFVEGGVLVFGGVIGEGVSDKKERPTEPITPPPPQPVVVRVLSPLIPSLSAVSFDRTR